MNLEQLSKEDTKLLEISSHRLDSVLIPDRKTLLELMDKSLVFHHWKLVHNENSENPYTEWKTLSNILGFRQNYTKTYSARNAVWGLYLKDKPDAKFLIYWSDSGLTVQYERNLPIDRYESIIGTLSKILVKGKTDTEIIERYMKGIKK